MNSLKATLLTVTLSIGLFAFNSNLNTFTLEGTSYNLEYGYLESYGVHPDGNSTDFDLHFSSVTKEEHLTTNGMNYIYIDLHSDKNQNKPSTGVYTFSEAEGKARQPFTFVGADVMMNYNTNTEQGEVYYAIGGEIEVKEKNGKYKVKYDLLLSNNETLTGEYTGQLLTW